MPRPLSATRLVTLALCTVGTAQSIAKIDAEQRLDPFTKNDPAALQRLGYRSLGPFSWGRTYGTDHITRTLGARRMLWVETAHFKLGCDLAPRVLAGETRLRRRVTADLTELKKKLPRVEPRNRKLSRWTLLHLYAHRLEALYAQFAADLGVADTDFPSGDGQRTPGRFMGDGPYLGQRGKFCVLLFDQPEQLERYLKAYAKIEDKAPRPRRHFLKDAGSFVFATASGCFMGQLHEDLYLHNHVTGEVVKNLAEGYKTNLAPLPPWWIEGLGHYYRRRVDPRINLIDPEADPAEAAFDAWDWATKVRARVKHDYYPRADKLLAETDTKTWRRQSHMMSWARVDFLMQRDRHGMRRYLDAIKDRPIPWRRRPEAKIRAWQAKALHAGWGLSLDEFDREWRKYVLTVYPK